jgi:hypothetical protein
MVSPIPDFHAELVAARTEVDELWAHIRHIQAVSTRQTERIRDLERELSQALAQNQYLLTQLV